MPTSTAVASAEADGRHPPGMVAGVVIALLGALSFAAAAALQATATRKIALSTAPPTNRLHRVLPVLRLLPAMLTDRIWWSGLACNGLGFMFHAVALHIGSIGIVQALLCVQIVLAVPLAAWRARTAPRLCDWIGSATACLGIVTLIGVRGSVPQTLERTALVPGALFSGLAVMVALTSVAATRRTTARTALIGVAAGTGFSLTAVFIVLVTALLARDGWWALLGHWQLYALGASGLIAAVLAQDAFASGSFPAALTTMTVADPLAAWLWGALLFDQRPPTTLPAVAGLATAGALISAGIAVLAYSSTLTREGYPRDD